jgi:hypothetical protein
VIALEYKSRIHQPNKLNCCGPHYFWVLSTENWIKIQPPNMLLSFEEFQLSFSLFWWHLQLGGPSWKDSLGRRDSTIANITAANTFIPALTSNPSGLKAIFLAQGLSFKNMVALSGNSV